MLQGHRLFCLVRSQLVSPPPPPLFPFSSPAHAQFPPRRLISIVFLPSLPYVSYSKHMMSVLLFPQHSLPPQLTPFLPSQTKYASHHLLVASPLDLSPHPPLGSLSDLFLPSNICLTILASLHLPHPVSVLPTKISPAPRPRGRQKVHYWKNSLSTYKSSLKSLGL